MAQAISNSLGSNLSTTTQRKLGIGKPSTYNYKSPTLEALKSKGNTTALAPVKAPALTSQTQPVPARTQPTVNTTVPPVTNTGVVPPPKQVTPVTTAPANPNSYSGLVGRVANASSPSVDQNRLLKGIEGAAGGNKAIGDDARRISEMYGQEISRVGGLGSAAASSRMSKGTTVVGLGNANLASQAASNRMNSLAAGLAAELQGTQQQLSAQGQTAEALGTGLGAANTQQQQAISGLSTAAGLAQPSPSQYGQTVFNPLTGQFAGGNMDPNVQAQSLAQQVMSGRMTYDQALASLGYAGQAGTNFLNNALTGAGGNPLQLQAQSAGQQANIATQTTASTDIARQGLQEVTQQYVTAQTFNQAAKEASDRAMTILEQTGLNNISSTDYNKAANELRSRFGDANFAAYQTSLNEAKNFYTGLLGTGGGTPTGQQNIADSIAALNTSTPIKAVVASMEELQNAASIRLRALDSARQQYGQNLGGGNTGAYSGGGTGSGQAITWDSII